MINHRSARGRTSYASSASISRPQGSSDQRV